MITLDVNLKPKATTQYQNFNFNSMVKLNGEYLGASKDGLFTIGGDTDNGANIDARMKLIMTDLGIHNPKRIRFAHFGYEADGDLVFKVIMDDGKERVFPVKSATSGQQRERVPIGRDGYGRYIQTTLENSNGSDFSLDSIILTIKTRNNGIS